MTDPHEANLACQRRFALFWVAVWLIGLLMLGWHVSHAGVVRPEGAQPQEALTGSAACLSADMLQIDDAYRAEARAAADHAPERVRERLLQLIALQSPVAECLAAAERRVHEGLMRLADELAAEQ